MKEIKDRLAEGLRYANMTPIELARKTGIPKSSISQYMSGYAKPRSDRIYLMSKALGVDEAWLLGYDVPIVKSHADDEEIYKKQDLTSSAFLCMRLSVVKMVGLLMITSSNM